MIAALTLPEMASTIQPKMSFGPWLKQRRRSLDLTQADFARQVGCAANTIKKLESGVLRPSKQLAELIAVYLGVPPAERPAFVSFARSTGDDYAPPFGAPRTSRPPTAAAPAPRSHGGVPASLTPLIGREREVTAGRQLLQRPATRLLTLYGPPGVGKTRLALEIALGLQNEFAQGACFVPLAPIADPDMVLPAIAQALRVREAPGQALLATVQSHLRDKRLLLVLDNFEQIIDAAPLLKTLLVDAPGVKALVTSRELLRLYGEQGFPVPPLPLPDAHPQRLPPVEALALYPSVQMFVERVKATKPDFALTPTNAADVAQICAWLDGLPLAIEMAAGQVKWLSMHRLLLELSHRLAALNGGLRDLSPRQQTLRGAIDWSYNLLSPAERVLFTRISIFSGGFTIEAAQAVMGNTPSVVSGLELLADKSLLRNDIGPEGESRFTMLETIREYAREKLRASGDEMEAQRRHATYYLSLARLAEPELNGRHQDLWLNRLDAESNNFRAALEWCVPHDLNIGLQLASALWQFYLVRGYLSEGLARLEVMLARPGEEVSPALRARALRATSALIHKLGDPARAAALAEQSLALYQELGDRKGVASALHLLGNVALMQSDYTRADDLYSQALSLYRETGSQMETALVLTNLGLIAKDQGRYAQATALYEESRVLHQRMGNRRGVALAYTFLSIVAYWLGDYARAAAQAEHALSAYREMGNKMDEAYALENLGMSRFKLGDVATARRLLSDSLDILRELGDKSGVALVLTDLGTLRYAQGDWDGAAASHCDGLASSVEVGDRRRIAFCLEGLAMDIARGEPCRAAQLFGAAERLREIIGAPLPPSERADYDAAITLTRGLLGENDYTTAYTAGRAFSQEQAVALALGA
jgi:predicted ATPase/transcriptional regulator with XRE-family HTH domain